MNFFASCNLSFEVGTVLQSVTQKKWCSRPRNVLWSHNGSSMSLGDTVLGFNQKDLNIGKKIWEE